ncbi:cysteine-rich protein 3 isoform X2 [Pangasianodon hypophthalmus]|uniref:cysteine-rich protein 3 isoform X2 n=1 Tax=Pangasianodon hypophthalmus TaxID=310915 RepID=UPI002307B7B4|nr:cysteine-rich protein 3 isoform X2 [Pangasianodon hypophthalmus]
MTSKCPRCEEPVFFAEKVSSLGKNWHRFCLKCERCNKILSPGGHAEHEGLPYCHKPCYGTLFGPKGVNIGGAGSYVYDTPPQTLYDGPSEVSPKTPWSISHIEHHQPKVPAVPIRMFSGETSLCPGCGKVVYFAERVMSLGRNWHRPCLRCERCKKTLTSGGHAELCFSARGSAVLPRALLRLPVRPKRCEHR